MRVPSATVRGSWTQVQRIADARPPSRCAFTCDHGLYTSMMRLAGRSFCGLAAASSARSIPYRAISSVALAVNASASAGVAPSASALASSLRTRSSSAPGVSAITHGLPFDVVEYNIETLRRRDDSFRNRAVLRDPVVDPLPPVVQPLLLSIVAGRPRHLVRGDAPPLRADEMVDRQRAPDIGDRDEPVEAGVRHEDHVGLRAGGDGRDHPAGPGRQQVRHLPRAGREAPAPLEPLDAAPPPARRPVAALGEDHQGAAAV